MIPKMGRSATAGVGQKRSFAYPLQTRRLLIVRHNMSNRGCLSVLAFLALSLNANAGIFGFSGDSWKEEVLLHDEQKIILERSQTYGGRSEPGQSGPIKEHIIRFTLPGSNQTITWVSEFSDDLGRTNFNLLAVHVLNGIPYVVVEPNLCLSYNKWGRPNPPYVFFIYDGKEWQRIPLSEFPTEFKTLNVAIYLGHQDVDLMVREGLVSPETIKRRNSELTQYPRYRSILREPYTGAAGGCEELIKYKGRWIMPNDPVMHKLLDSNSK
jgi:hypothetical protein